MTTDPQSTNADQADVAEQQQDVEPPVDDDEVPDLKPMGVPLEANEADVAEQRTEVLGWDDDADQP